MHNIEHHLRSLRLTNHRQAIVVETSDWNSCVAKLHCYERDDDEHSNWQEVDRNIPSVVGKNGLGWGIGLHPLPEQVYPFKREGDGKAPAGIFPLHHAFGFAPTCHTKLNYMQVVPTVEAIDDPLSHYYNKIIDTRDIDLPDWKSSEKMYEYPDQYALGIVVGHNVSPIVPYRGSCIFMHVWSSPETGTAGCTATSKSHMEMIIKWLDRTANPILIQQPKMITMQLSEGRRVIML